MKVLCITDQFSGSHESLIEGIFKEPFPSHCTVFVIFFSRDAKSVIKKGNEIIVPYRYKKHGIGKLLERHLDLNEIDVVIVRNFFAVLRSFLQLRSRYRFRLGFWNTFPHTFRRYFEALQERRSVFRKRIEYLARTFIERKLVRRCDFLVVMSEEFKRDFYGDIDIPYHTLPMGFELDETPPRLPAPDGPKRFVYIGTIDRLRRIDVIVDAMTSLENDFVLDIYTQSDNDAVDWIRRHGDRRIRLSPPLPRPQLLQRLAGYDIGIGLIPENRLYNVSSPTKTVEYYAVGLPALVNYLPEYRSLFDDDSAYFCPFTHEGIRTGVLRVLHAERRELVEKGCKGKERIEASRNYAFLKCRVLDFLSSVKMG